MTPLHLLILIHYYISFEEYSKHDLNHANSITTMNYTHELVIHGVLAKRDEIHLLGSRYEITDKGRFFINYILNLPFPIQKWEMPNECK